MKNSYRDVIRVLKYILFNQGCTITEISAAMNYTNTYVIEILLSIVDDPFNGISLFYQDKYKDKCVFKDISEKELISKVRWSLDVKKLDSIPTSIFNVKEKILLNAVVECSGLTSDGYADDEMPDLLQDASITTVFLFDIPQKSLEETRNTKLLIKSVQERRYIKAVYANTSNAFLLRPHGFIRNDVTGEWFLICQDEFKNVKALSVKKLKSIELKTQTFTRNIPLNREWAQKMMEGRKVEVEVEFEGYEGVIEKVRHELGCKGDFYKAENGKVIFKGQIGDIEGFRTYVMRLGSLAKVIAPQWLKEGLVEDMKKLAALTEQKERDYING